MMSNQQVNISELLLSLDSPELQEAELVRAAVNQQLSTDRGGAVLWSLVDHYLDSSSPQVVLLLSSIREPHHKALLEKLNETLNRPGSRLAGLTLLGHLIRNQPPWVHHIRHSALLASLLRCLKTGNDVVVLITGVLVLITLLPMIPQAGKQHIYDFFDVFGRLSSWSHKNPGQVPVVHLVHLHAGVYSLFHRLYGMFPCNFMSYLRIHYSMKENLDTFQEVVKPMLDHVRVHPELVTGTQDYELDPSRWKCYEVHDIVIECSRVSLDPLESSCEEDMCLSLRDPHLDLSSSPQTTETISSSGPLLSERLPQLTTLNNSYIQADDVTWSPSSLCGLSTPPPEPATTGSSHPLSRTASISGDTDISSQPSSSSSSSSSSSQQPSSSRSEEAGSAPSVQSPTPHPSRSEEAGSAPSVQSPTPHPSRSEEAGSAPSARSPAPHPSWSEEAGSAPSARSSAPHPSRSEEAGSAPSAQSPAPSAQSPAPHPSRSEEAGSAPSARSPAPHPSRSEEAGSAPSARSPAPHPSRSEEAGSAPSARSPAPNPLPRAATLLIGRMTQEVLETAEGPGEDREEDQTSVSPLEVLDQLIVHGHDAHQHLSRRWSAGSKPGDRTHCGGKQQSMKTKGPQGEELQCVRSQLLLVYSQLQYERFKRQQHAIRNRRLLRRVVNATALEEHSIAMKGQLSVQDEEIRSLKSSLQEEHQRYTHLQQETHTHTNHLHTHIQQLMLQHLDEQRDKRRLESELQECQSKLRDLEAELQKANNKAYNAEHQLTQLSLKLCSSEQLQQQMFLMNQQLVLLRGTNRTLTEHLEGRQTQQDTEVSMLQCTVGNEFQRLKDNDVQQRQKLEAANHRIAELENQLAKRDQLLLDQKKLLEDTKAQSRGELSACEGLCAALRRITQTLQTETLHLYSQIHLGTHSWPQIQSGTHSWPQIHLGTHSWPQDVRPPPSSSGGLINGGAETLDTSPLHPASCSSSPLSLSPIDSPLAVGSFLEQRARQLFRPPEEEEEEEEQEEEEQEEEEEEEEEQEEEEQEEEVVEEAQPESPPLGQEAETLLTGSPQTEPPSWASAPSRPPSGPPDLTVAVRQRRRELSIMDYDETEGLTEE